MEKLESWVKQYVLPLYGRKMIIAIFAAIMYVMGVQWDQIAAGFTAVMDTNSYFKDDGMWFYGIMFIFMGGQAIDQMTNKFDDFLRAKKWSIWKFIQVKTREIIQPRPFLVWAGAAIAFACGILSDEMLFYFSASYVGVNGAEALITHIRTAQNGMSTALSNLRESVDQPEPGEQETEEAR